MKHPFTELHNKDMNKTWMFHDQPLQMVNIIFVF